MFSMESRCCSVSPVNTVTYRSRPPQMCRQPEHIRGRSPSDDLLKGGVVGNERPTNWINDTRPNRIGAHPFQQASHDRALKLIPRQKIRWIGKDGPDWR